MKTGIQLTTLGRLLIQQDGHTVDNLISTKAVLLLVYLAMHPGEHTRRKLATMFWSDTSAQQALKNLRTVLSSVRGTLPDVLIVSRESIMCNPDANLWVDASAFAKGCTAAMAANMTLSLDEMAAVVALYEGIFLADVAVRGADALDEWIAEKQRELAQMYANLLNRMAELAYTVGEYEAGVRYARQLVAHEPLWDVARRQLMRLLALSNHTNEALQQYEAFTRLLHDELAAVPEAETTALYEQIRSQTLAPPKPAVQSTIVLPEMPFVESVSDTAFVQRMLSVPQCKLLTVHGISGIGKTAFVTQLAYNRQHLYPDGTYLVSLRDIESVRDLPYLIAGTIGIEIAGQSDHLNVQTIVLDALQNRHMLLVLDNYEHLLPETDFIEQLLNRAANLQIIVTSQTPLNLFREWLLPLSGMSVPPVDDPHPEAYESVQLFERTAQRVNPRFSLADYLDPVAEICRLVDGLPLAIIVVAGWTQVVPIDKIIDAIEEGQEFRLPFQQTLPPRHQSLERVLDYTWSTLTETERYALTALSVFSGAFGLEDVEQVAEVDLMVLTAMVQRALVQKYEDRYRMHGLVWRYARKQLQNSPARTALGERYRDHMLRKLDTIRQQNPMIHDYLLATELDYANITNTDWMVADFKPMYLLAISPYLMAYWQVSRTDAIPAVLKTLEAADTSQLPSETVAVFNLQLARLWANANDRRRARAYILRAMAHSVLRLGWHDVCMLFMLYHSLAHMPSATQQIPAVGAGDDDATIIRTVHLKLASLYVDMRDYIEASGLLVYLLEQAESSLERARVTAVRGAIAAEKDDYAATLGHFRDALTDLPGDAEPLLRLSLHVATMRVTAELDKAEDVREHFGAALQLAIDERATPAAGDLLDFGSATPWLADDPGLTPAFEAARQLVG